jgi:hypothetical protein
MASQWRTFQRLAEHLVFNEAPKLIRQLQSPNGVQRTIQQGIQRTGLGPRVDQNTLHAGRTHPGVRVRLPWSDRAHPKQHLHRRLLFLLE